MLVEVQTTVSDDAFGDDGVGHPILSSNRVVPKYGDKDYTNGKCDGKLLEWGSREPSETNVVSGAHKAFSFWDVLTLYLVVE